MESHGAHITHHAAITDSNGLRGVVSRAAIDKGQFIASVAASLRPTYPTIS